MRTRQPNRTAVLVGRVGLLGACVAGAVLAMGVPDGCEGMPETGFELGASGADLAEQLRREREAMQPIANAEELEAYLESLETRAAEQVRVGFVEIELGRLAIQDLAEFLGAEGASERVQRFLAEMADLSQGLRVLAERAGKGAATDPQAALQRRIDEAGRVARTPAQLDSYLQKLTVQATDAGDISAVYIESGLAAISAATELDEESREEKLLAFTSAMSGLAQQLHPEFFKAAEDEAELDAAAARPAGDAGTPDAPVYHSEEQLDAYLARLGDSAQDHGRVTAAEIEPALAAIQAFEGLVDEARQAKTEEFLQRMAQLSQQLQPELFKIPDLDHDPELRAPLPGAR